MTTQELVVEIDRLKQRVRIQRRELRRLNSKLKFVMATAQFPLHNPELPTLEEAVWTAQKATARAKYLTGELGRVRGQREAAFEDGMPTARPESA